MRAFAFAAIAASMLAGSVAHSDTRQPRLEFRCKLESSKAKGGECWARGEIRFDVPNRDVQPLRADIQVGCTDGFRLSDEDAYVKFTDDIIIKARDDGEKAKLVINDVPLGRGEEFDAKLETLHEDGREHVYFGECSLREEVGDADDDVDARDL